MAFWVKPGERKIRPGIYFVTEDTSEVFNYRPPALVLARLTDADGVPLKTADGKYLAVRIN